MPILNNSLLDRAKMRILIGAQYGSCWWPLFADVWRMYATRNERGVGNVQSRSDAVIMKLAERLLTGGQAFVVSAVTSLEATPGIANSKRHGTQLQAAGSDR